MSGRDSVGEVRRKVVDVGRSSSSRRCSRHASGHARRAERVDTPGARQRVSAVCASGEFSRCTDSARARETERRESRESRESRGRGAGGGIREGRGEGTRARGSGECQVGGGWRVDGLIVCGGVAANVVHVEEK